MKSKLAPSASLLVYLLLAWWIGSLLKLKSPEIWILRFGLAVLGVAGAAAWLWLQPRITGKPAARPAVAAEPLPVEREIDFLLNEAAQRLRRARLHGGSSIGSLPVFFLLGDSGSAKTSTLTNSGLDPELLAGQVHSDSQIVSTRLANLWFARRTIWVEAGGALTGDAEAWQHLVRRLEAGKIAAVFGGKRQAPRAAVVFFDCENFNAPGASQAVAARARALNTRLQEVSRLLGISFPVYALFTRMDRLRYFTDFARCLTDEEVGRTLGITLPLAKRREAGAYGDVQTQRLTEAFDNLFHMTADARPEFLARESQSENLPNIYEFPREFRKIRALAVQFLVDLCRPPQLAAGPFLRGFYFSGIRPVMIEERRPSTGRSAAFETNPQVEMTSDATRFFDLTRMPSQPTREPVASYTPVSRRVPQWVFLKQLFHELLLGDTATAASASSVKASLLQRILLCAAAAMCLTLAIGFLVSYGGNRRLEQRAIAAAHPGTPAASGQADVSLTELQRLEDTRQLLVELREHKRSGAPLSLRWGLYTGDALEPRLRRLYFDRFGQMLFAGTQNGLLNDLRALPPTPGTQDVYEPPYNKLKAYLITTSHHEKSTREFLSPLLFDRWAQGRKDAGREQIARKQFDFYSEELRLENPYSSQTDMPTVEKARHYLNQFGGAESRYRAIIADASGRSPSIQFNRTYPGSAGIVVNKYEVPGAFTAAGWNLVQGAFQNPRQGGEDWVVGDSSGMAKADAGQLGETLRAHYRKDYTTHWRNYLRAGSVVRYTDFKDAAGKLNQLSGPQSFLLAMLALAAKNTGVGDAEITGAFKAVHSVVPGPDLISQNNTGYMKALVELQIGIEQGIGERGIPDDAAVSQIRTQANTAKGIVRQLALNFGGDPEAATVSKLLQDPIVEVEGRLREHGGLNAKGKALCGQLHALLLNKYPFNPRAAAEATPQDLQAVLGKPGGALWQFYEANLRENLIRQGEQYAPAPASSTSFTPQFLRSFNALAHLSDALYSGNSQEPRLNYTLRVLPSQQLQNVTLVVDGQKVSSSGSPTSLVWPGKGVQSVKSSVLGLEWANHEGVWSIFRFLDSAKTWTPSGATSILEWDIVIGGRRAATLRMELGGPAEIVQRGYLARLGCVAEVVR